MKKKPIWFWFWNVECKINWFNYSILAVFLGCQTTYLWFFLGRRGGGRGAISFLSSKYFVLFSSLESFRKIQILFESFEIFWNLIGSLRFLNLLDHFKIYRIILEILWNPLEKFGWSRTLAVGILWNSSESFGIFWST